MRQFIKWCWDLREHCAQINLPSPVSSLWFPIRSVIILMQRLSNPTRQVIPLIFHIRLYPPHHSHLDTPTLSFPSTTLPSSWNTQLHYHSLSLHAMILTYHNIQHTPRTAYIQYSIHWVQYTPRTAYTEYYIHWVQHTLSIAYAMNIIHPWLFAFPSSSWLCIDPWMVPQFDDTSLHDRPPSASSPWELNKKVA